MAAITGTLGIIGIMAWLASMEGRAWLKQGLSSRTQRGEMDLQTRMLEAEQEGTTRASKESAASYEKHLSMLMQMNQDALDRNKEQRLTDLYQGSKDRQMDMMMQTMQMMSQGPQMAPPPSVGRMALLRRGY